MSDILQTDRVQPNFFRCWHIIEFSESLKPGSSVKKTLYGIPIVLWRDKRNKVHAVADVCSHKKSPLEVSCFEKNEIRCPYHGWKYNEQGKLTEIPSAPNAKPEAMNCSLQKFQTAESNGCIWLLPECESSVELETLEHAIALEGNWRSYRLQQEFNTNVEMLVDNFMDATHTAFIHKGIIRGMGEKVQHSINLSTNNMSVKAEFAETNEKVAFGLRFLLGRNLKIKHIDTFLLPNIVRVDYFINNVHRFNALIVCSQASEGKTIANIRLSYNFNALNPLVRLFLPGMAKKVVMQDYEITQKQYLNYQVFPDRKEHYSECDLIHNKVKLVRKAFAENKPVRESETTIQFFL